MKSAKKYSKIIAILLIVFIGLPFITACGGDGGNNTGATAAENITDPTTEAPTEPPTEPPPTEPPTEKETEPPTEPPTDPAELPEPDVIGDFEIIPGARYYLWSPNSNLYLTADGDYKYAGFTQDDYTGKPDQMFVFEKVRTDEVNETTVRHIYKIRALGSKNGYIDIEEADGATDGAGVIITSEPEGEGSQEWSLKAQRKTKTDDDDFADIDLPLFSVNSVIARNSKVLDVSGVSVSPGGLIHLWGGGTANNQKWFFELVSDVEAGNIVPRGEQEIPY
jgi:hypothetical protein